jgi:hypothetical protein
MKTTTTLPAALILAVFVMNCSAQDSDLLTDAAMATVISGSKGNSVINDNGRAAFVTANGDGTGVIFQDRGTTTVQKIGDTTFIVPSGNPVAPGSGRQR